MARIAISAPGVTTVMFVAPGAVLYATWTGIVVPGMATAGAGESISSNLFPLEDGSADGFHLDGFRLGRSRQILLTLWL